MIMCLKKISLRPKSRVYFEDSSQVFVTDVPCGHCCECRQAKKDEWQFRLYYEILSTFNKGGYVLSQCLTYRPDARPHISDFLGDALDSDFICFNRNHIKKFLKLLRTNLKRHCNFDPAKKLRYFIAAEYGTSVNHDHASHYHGLFFIDDSSLPWDVLSAQIDCSWKYGLTDSILSHPRSYFINSLKPHLFTSDLRNNLFALNKAISYVTEYLLKDSQYEKKIVKTFNMVNFNLKRNSQIPLDKKVLRQVRQFHVQSSGFGIEFYLYNDMNDVLENGRISMPGIKPSLPRVYIPLPVYYQRKLFCELKDSFDGSLRWYWKKDSIPFQVSMLKARLFANTLKFDSILLNLNDFQRSCINLLLDKRPLARFVEYLFLYRGRLRKYGSLVPLPDRQLNDIVNSRYEGSEILISPSSFDDNVFIAKNLDLNETYYFEKSKDYYDEDSDERFHDFDKLYYFISDCLSARYGIKEVTANFIHQFKKRKLYERNSKKSVGALL